MKACKYTILFFTISIILQSVICVKDCIPKIAIIGGGIGGASTSHFLSEYFNSSSLKIDLFERNEIGGRLGTVNINGNDYESGGSIIHNENKLMNYFMKYLGLEKVTSTTSTTDDVFGIWNGDNFVFIESTYTIVTLVRLIHRYGTQPIFLQRYITKLLSNFDKVYKLQDDYLSFDNVSSLLKTAEPDFFDDLSISIKDRLMNLGYTDSFIDELVKATIVVNYGQSTDIQSFVGSVSLAGAGASLWAVKGGNKEVPKRLILQNKNVRVVPAFVKKIRHSDGDKLPKYTVYYEDKATSQLMSNVYDVVIIATPLTHDQEMLIEFENFPKGVNFEFPGDYMTLYVTFVKGQLNFKYFGLDESIGSILSCDVNKTIFTAVAKLSTVEGEKSDVWKIFSLEQLKNEFIDKMFITRDEVKQVKWKSYPKYSTEVYANKFKLHDSLYHINAIEWAASAMEMSAIGGKNIALLTYNDNKQKCENIHDENKYETSSKRQKLDSSTLSSDL